MLVFFFFFFNCGMWFLSHHCVLEEVVRGTGNFFLVCWSPGCR